MRLTGIVAVPIGVLLAVLSLGASHSSVERYFYQQSAMLAGQVVDHASGTPLVRVRVLLSPAASVAAVQEVSTDANGRFQFNRLAPGVYNIRASSPGWLPSAYGQQKPDRLGVPIAIGAGEAVEGLAIRLFRGAVITGRVFVASSQPDASALVQLYRLRFGRRGRYLELEGTALTNDLGEYRFFGLAPATYYVRATHSGPPVAALGPSAVAGVASKMGLSRNFYVDGTDPASATVVSVDVADIRTGIDLVMRETPLPRVSGQMSSLGGRVKQLEVRSMFETLPLRVPDVVPSNVSPSGQFELSSLSPGPLLLGFRATIEGQGDMSGRVRWGVARLVVGNAGVSDLHVDMLAGVSVSGRVLLNARPGNLPSIESVEVTLRPLDLIYGSVDVLARARVRSDARFVVPDVPPGRYEVAFNGLPAPWAVESADHDGVNVALSGLDVGDTEIIGLNVGLTNQPASLSGAVRQPVATAKRAYTVIAFPIGSETKGIPPLSVYATNTDVAGRYLFSSLIPGNYYVTLSDDIEIDAWYDPRVLAEFAGRATRVTIPRNLPVRQDLGIATLAFLGRR